MKPLLIHPTILPMHSLLISVPNKTTAHFFRDDLLSTADSRVQTWVSKIEEFILFETDPPNLQIISKLEDL